MLPSASFYQFVGDFDAALEALVLVPSRTLRVRVLVCFHTNS